MKRARNSAIEKRDQLTSAPNHRPDQVAADVNAGKSAKANRKEKKRNQSGTILTQS